jgi:hypothetical protein
MPQTSAMDDDESQDVIDPGRPDGRSMAARRQPTTLEAFTRLLPIIAVAAMVFTFLLLPQPFAVAMIGLVWVVATRGGGGRLFLGLTLTQALAWSATIVIAFLLLLTVLYALGASTG